MRKGQIFVISAPSGCGKTTICKRISKKIKFLVPSISVTTRRPRPGERRGKDYYYISRRFFEKEIKKGNLLEWEENFGYLYGTPKRFIREKLKRGKNLLLSIDVKGAMNVKKIFPESTLIFIKPPSMAELARRLKSRNTDADAEIGDRLKIAKKELKFAKRYNYVVVNKKLEDAVNEVVSIIKKKMKGK
ncbi:MAG: guanylate kinase [Candidatus Omnitrophota bacterium]|nr:MAG: guanylate kinase [Candidatus Omnitrophota bacterium]